MTDLKDMITNFDIETRPAEYQINTLDNLMTGKTRMAFGKLGNAAEHASLAMSGLSVTHRRFMVINWPEPTGKKKHYLRRQAKRMQRFMDRANRQMAKALFYENL